MALTQQDILAIAEIFKPQFAALALQIADLKEIISANAEAHRIENDRRRDDVGNLYEKDRLRAGELSGLSTRVVALEEWRGSHLDADKAKEENHKFTVTTRVAIMGILGGGAFLILDRLVEWLSKLGGK